MKSYITILLFFYLGLASSLKCDEVECPPDSFTCNVNYFKTSTSKGTTATVVCYGKTGAVTYNSTQDSKVVQLELKPPEVKCAGHICVHGSWSCSSISEILYTDSHAKGTTYLTCYDGEGAVVEKREIPNQITVPFVLRIPDLVCGGYKCPEGSRRCLSDIKVQVKPVFNTSNHVTCFDKDNKLLTDVNL